jgi:hypothetical protein
MMELWHLPYGEIMSIPSTLRYRLLLKKQELENKRRAKLEKK